MLSRRKGRQRIFLRNGAAAWTVTNSYAFSIAPVVSLLARKMKLPHYKYAMQEQMGRTNFVLPIVF